MIRTYLLEKIHEGTKKIQEKDVEKLCKDFLQSVEKVSNKLSDKELSRVAMITIKYFSKHQKIFRSKVAVAGYYDSIYVEYEKEDICLGKKEELEEAFLTLKKYVSQDTNIKSDDFNIEVLFGCKDEEGIAELDFLVRK